MLKSDDVWKPEVQTRNNLIERNVGVMVEGEHQNRLSLIFVD